MRRLLQYFYTATACLAGLATVSIVLIIVYQVASRALGLGTSGADEIVAWLTACASLAGMGYAFTQGSHVRVELLIDRFSGATRWCLEMLALSVALGISGFAAYACTLMVIESYQFNAIAQGNIPIPLWIPQMGVAVGALSLAVAIADAWVLGACRHTFKQTERSPVAEI